MNRSGRRPPQSTEVQEYGAAPRALQTRPFWAKSAGEEADIRLAKDPAIDALDEETRASLAFIWAMRAGMELHVGAGFAVIFRELCETGADPSVLSICARAVADEVDHAEICLALAMRHDGETHPLPPAEPVFVPDHGDASGAMLATLHLVAMSCLNESIASVRLAAAIDDAESPVVASALRVILSDEVIHARAGWAHLVSRYVTDDMRREVSRWLPEMTLASIRGLVEENAALPPDGFAAHGLPSVSATRGVAFAALKEVVLPGFERCGVATAAVLPALAEVWPTVHM